MIASIRNNKGLSMEFFGTGWMLYNGSTGSVGLCVYEAQEVSFDIDPDCVVYTVIWEDGGIGSIKSKQCKAVDSLIPIAYNEALRGYMFSDIQTLEIDHQEGVFKKLFATAKTSLAPGLNYVLKVA